MSEVTVAEVTIAEVTTPEVTITERRSTAVFIKSLCYSEARYVNGGERRFASFASL